ncbi:MAG: carbohydrate ABC transporter permease [Capsulimonadales bacterium]|nr:carbohydrate ABC transporter permease [Capsulimonadales bacterium]
MAVATHRPITAQTGKLAPGTLAFRILLYSVLILATLCALVPFLWLVLATIKPSGEMFSDPWILVAHPTLANYQQLFTKELAPGIYFGRYLLNSVFITCMSVTVQLFLSSLAGFALAKYSFAGKKFVYLLMLATLMIPAQVTMAPTYELLYRMGLVDTYVGLIIPGAVSVFGIFLFERAMHQVPDELIHAARIDGCTEFTIYWEIVMPVTRPMIGAFCLIGFMGTWNSFLWPQIMLHTNHRFTLPIALNQMVGIYNQEYGMLMAGTFISVLPVIALFFMLQREFVAGLTSGAVKG